MLSEFKKFALRGNVIDLAIGVIIGAAFGADAHVDEAAVGGDRRRDVAHEELGLRREQHVGKHHVRIDSHPVSFVETFDRPTADVRALALDAFLAGLVAHPVRTHLRPLESFVVVRAERTRVQVPEVVHVDVVLDEQLRRP